MEVPGLRLFFLFLRKMLNSRRYIEDILACSVREPWLAGSERFLIKFAEEALLSQRGLSLESYGTARYLQGDTSEPRDEISRIERGKEPALIIEDIPQDVFSRYQAIGLRQRKWGKPDDCEVLATVTEAISYFNTSSSLKSIIVNLLRIVHVVEADNPSFDVSHSDPDVPLSAFISVPPRSMPHATLRVCESLLHECMHLQLSLVERHATFVTHSAPVLHSPWQTEPRPPNGLLHGVYVFTAILEFLHRLARECEDSVDLAYLRKRQSNISAELEQARCSLGVRNLTPEGIALMAAINPEGALVHRSE